MLAQFYLLLWKNSRILEVLTPLPWRESSAFWKYCSRKKRCRESKSRRESKSQAHFRSTVPRKNVRAYRGRALQRWPNFTFFYFYFSGDSTSIFPGTVLPFCHFSVVRKVPEKPVLFLPHPTLLSIYHFIVCKVRSEVVVMTVFYNKLYFESDFLVTHIHKHKKLKQFGCII